MPETPAGPSPLPLVPFERYMLADERPRFPMTIPLLWTVRGALDRDAWTEAWSEAVAKHVMLGRLVRQGAWVPSPDAFDKPLFFAEHEVPSRSDRLVDAYHGPLVRCNVLSLGEVSRVEIILHHAVCDGIASLEFSGDLFAAYATRSGAPPPRYRAPDNRALPQRGLLDRRIPHPVSRGVVLRTLVKETTRFLTRRAEAVRASAPPRTGDASATPWQILDRQLSQAASQQLEQAARAADVTPNDWTLTAFLRAIAAHNDAERGRVGRGWLVANMPVSMRPKACRRISASNTIGYAFVARRRAQLADWSTALASIAEERQLIQTWKYAGLFIDGLAITARLPGMLWLTTRPWLRPATCVMSHMGDPSRRFRGRFAVDAEGFPLAGNLRLEKLSSSAPTRPGTAVTGLLNQLGRRLTVSLRVSPEVISEEAAEALLARWIDEIMRHV